MQRQAQTQSQTHKHKHGVRRWLIVTPRQDRRPEEIVDAEAEKALSVKLTRRAWRPAEGTHTLSLSHTREYTHEYTHSSTRTRVHTYTSTHIHEYTTHTRRYTRARIRGVRLRQLATQSAGRRLRRCSESSMPRSPSAGGRRSQVMREEASLRSGSSTGWQRQQLMGSG